jgi:hypothetical protein
MKKRVQQCMYKNGEENSLTKAFIFIHRIHFLPQWKKAEKGNL